MAAVAFNVQYGILESVQARFNPPWFWTSSKGLSVGRNAEAVLLEDAEQNGWEGDEADRGKHLSVGPTNKLSFAVE